MHKPGQMSIPSFVLLLIIATSRFSSASASPAPDNYWQQFVHYKMNVSLDPATKFLTGTSSILYRNNSPDTLDKIYLHVYPNGFRSKETVRAKEAAREYVRNLPNDQAAGWIDISEFHILAKGETDPVQPVVTAFKVNDTILEAALPQPLLPGEEIRIELAFKEKVRQYQDRAGYRGNQFDFGQWYPKLCVYDNEGWHPEPLHFEGEFYGEFGTFDVTIDVPFDYIVGATGVVTEGDPGWSLVQADTSLSTTAWSEKYAEMKKSIIAQSKDTPRRRVTFHAEQVHDFAWVACPDFLYERGEYDGIPIHVLYRSHAKPRWTKVVTERGRRALEWLSTKFGRYPYPQLTITHGLLGGGMEYPMLVMNSSESEGLILHEVGHIYFYGILANNEQKEAWLDEGFTTFQTRWYFETRYGKEGRDRDEPVRQPTWLERHRPQVTDNVDNRNFAQFYMNSGYNEPISRYAYKYKNGLGYVVNAYTKGSILFEMLRYVVGVEVFEKICKEYFNRWAFKHVTEERFKQVCEEVSGMNLDWFFRQWLHETKTVDYKLGEIKKEKIADGKWQTTVGIERKDEGLMPVEIELSLVDQEKVRQRWDGKEKTGTLTFTTDAEPIRVVLDPDDQIMDKSRLGHGDMRIEFYPEYPRMNYHPPNVYVVTWKPNLWYNDIDGLRLGIRFNGDYRNTRRLSLAGWYGLNSSEVDGRFSFGNRIGNRMNYQISLMKLEGRIMGDLGLSTFWAKGLGTPPFYNLAVGINYSKLPENKIDYAFRRVAVADEIILVPTWTAGKVNQAYLTFNANPRGILWRSNLDYEVRHANSAFSSDFTFTRVQGQFRFWIPNRRGDGIYVRLFQGAFLKQKDDKPIQYLFQAFDASPHEQFESFYLRSRGAFPAEAHYHRPGGGNLRGYFDQPERNGKNLLAANLELRKSVRLPVIGSLLAPLLGNSALSAFFDTGRLTTLNDQSQQLSDAGLGITFN
ncbi:MAG: M1 family metallopeptidase, partial [candidate division KSB1 bacterium]|nr:M1 family metallopeptidase [candidate division KSB1 bacterium]